MNVHDIAKIRVACNETLKAIGDGNFDDVEFCITNMIIMCVEVADHMGIDLDSCVDKYFKAESRAMFLAAILGF